MNRAARLAFWTVSLAAALLGAAWVWRTYSGGTRRFLEIAGAIPPRLWPAILLGTAAFYALDWLRFYALLRVFGTRLSWTAGLRLTFVSDFVCSLTPVTELNLPAMVYFLGREGVPAATAAAVSLAKSLLMTVWLCALAGLGLQLDAGARLPSSVSRVLPLSLTCVALLSIPLAALAFFPKPLLDWCARRLEPPGVGPWRRRILEGVRDTAVSIAAIGGASGRWQAWVNASCVLSVAVYAAVGWLLARGVGLDPDWRRASSAFPASLMVAYLAPVPGSVGVTEWATSYLLDPAMTPEGMAAAILLRTLTCYAGIPVGAVFVAIEAWRRGMRLPAD